LIPLKISTSAASIICCRRADTVPLTVTAVSPVYVLETFHSHANSSTGPARDFSSPVHVAATVCRDLLGRLTALI
jgi:hypothetical protein